MKRPFCILTLSDLHIIGESEAGIVTSLRKAIQDFVSTNSHWTTPDFVIVAGDLFNANNSNPQVVKKVIDAVISEESFSLDPFRVILTPGNHDKDFCVNNLQQAELNDYVHKELEKYERFKSYAADNKQFDVAAEFCGSFARFASLYEPFMVPSSDKEEKFFVGIKDSNREIAHTSSLKIFHEFNTCFLSVNTEWTYMPRLCQKYLKDDELSRLKAMPLICRPIVKRQLEEFATKYSNYSLITLMHRNPYDVSWSERASMPSDSPDILQYIFHYSDIILSGHDHCRWVAPPNLLGNQAQAFQLGSASMSARPNSWRQLNAGLMMVNHISRVVRFVQFYYHEQFHTWCHKSEYCYPLANKYGNPNALSTINQKHQCLDEVLTIKALSLTEADIKKAICDYYPHVHDVICMPVDAPGLEDTVGKRIEHCQSRLFIVLYAPEMLRPLKDIEYANQFHKSREALISRFPTEFYSHRFSICQVYVSTRQIDDYRL